MNIATLVKSFDTAHAVDFDAVVGKDLASAVPTIDTAQYYPEDVMRALGAAGSYGSRAAEDLAARNAGQDVLFQPVAFRG